MITEANVLAAWSARHAARRPLDEQLADAESGNDPVHQHLERLGVDVDSVGASLAYLLKAYQDRTDMTVVGLLGTFFLEGVELGVRAARRETPGSVG